MDGTHGTRPEGSSSHLIWPRHLVIGVALPVPAKAVEDLLPALEQTDSVTNMDLDSPLLALAQKLLEVESILNSHIQLLGEPVEEQKSQGFIPLPAPELRRIISSLLDECVTSLHEAQEAIRKRIDGDSEANYEEALQQISGALKIAAQDEVAALTEKLGIADFFIDYRRQTGTVAVIDCKTLRTVSILRAERDLSKYREAIAKATPAS